QTQQLPGTQATADSEVEDEAIQAVNLDLDQTNAAEHFAEEPTGDIWNQPAEEEDESDTPAFLRRRKKNKKNKDDK
ncbi:MAG: hypothetical protein ABJA64_03250, partial [Candidatus Saccharibacteria bacterium]